MTKNKCLIIVLISIAFLFSCTNENNTLEKPSIFEFGSSMEQLEGRLIPLSDSLKVRLDEPIQLPTAKNSQSQLDVYGFEFEGKKRHVELIFADNALDIVWILIEKDETQHFIDELKGEYGAPTHVTPEATFFLNHGIAVKNTPHEVLFISERLKAPYGQFLKMQSASK